MQKILQIDFRYRLFMVISIFATIGLLITSLPIVKANNDADIEDYPIYREEVKLNIGDHWEYGFYFEDLAGKYTNEVKKKEALPSLNTDAYYLETTGTVSKAPYLLFWDYDSGTVTGNDIIDCNTGNVIAREKIYDLKYIDEEEEVNIKYIFNVEFSNYQYSVYNDIFRKGMHYTLSYDITSSYTIELDGEIIDSTTEMKEIRQEIYVIGKALSVVNGKAYDTLRVQNIHSDGSITDEYFSPYTKSVVKSSTRSEEGIIEYEIQLLSFNVQTNLKDNDNDGHRDPEDKFPNDKNEYMDSDGDGIGDNSDKFPNDVSEWEDKDGDGIGDNSDKFPNDVSEWEDSDDDGVGDISDSFPFVKSEWMDSDGDGIGDNSDLFPFDPTCSKDSDRDGYPDCFHNGGIGYESQIMLPQDYYPFDAEKHLKVEDKTDAQNWMVILIIILSFTQIILISVLIINFVLRRFILNKEGKPQKPNNNVMNAISNLKEKKEQEKLSRINELPVSIKEPATNQIMAEKEVITNIPLEPYYTPANPPPFSMETIPELNTQVIPTPENQYESSTQRATTDPETTQ